MGIISENLDKYNLTVDFSGDVKLGDSKKYIIAWKVRGGHGV